MQDNELNLAHPADPQRYPAFQGERLLRVVRCDSSPLATVVLLHGGAFLDCRLDTIAPAAKTLADRLASVVLAPAYSLAGDAPFPAAAEDAYAALAWAAAHAREGDWPARPLVVIGIEAGGNLAAAAAMMARDRGEPNLAAQVLVRPMLDPSQSSRSMRECPQHEAERCRAAWRAYLPSGADQVHPYAAPLASLRVAGLAPALILTAAGDPLRDEAEAYAANLIRAGVTTQVTRLAQPSDHALADADTLEAIAAFVGPRIACASHS
jgi:acetyl esterase/lipase